jgi:hypothetical protein
MVARAGLMVSAGKADTRIGVLKLNRITGIVADMDVATVLVTVTALVALALSVVTNPDATTTRARTMVARRYLVTFQE